MRILLVSDLHYTLKQLDWVTSVAGEHDLVVLAGDQLDIASIVAPDAQIAVVLEYLARLSAKTTVIACSGNHDLNAQNDLGERAASWLDAARGSGVFVDGTRLEADDVLITVCPWWDGPLTCEVVDRQLADATWGTGISLALASNLINNLPMGLITGSAVNGADVGMLVRSAATIGIDLGPNLSVTGSLATILWLTAIRREGEHVSAWTFLRLGAVVMPVALLLAMASLFLMPH